MIYPIIFICVFILTSGFFWTQIDTIIRYIDNQTILINWSHIIENSHFIIYIFTKTDIESSRYMLSLLVQSQVTILAIVVSLSLVAMQLASSSYSSRVVDLLKNSPDFWILLIIYIVSIIIGVSILKLIQTNEINNFNLENYISNTYRFGIVAILILIPYIWNVLELMRPSTIIYKLSQKITAKRVLSIQYIGDNNDPIQPITDIIVKSLMRYDEGTVLIGLKTLSSRITTILDGRSLSGHEEIFLSEVFYHHISEIGFLAIQRNDQYASIQVIRNIEQVGLVAIKNNFRIASIEAVYSIRKVGLKAVEKGFEDVAIQAEISLSIMGFESIKQGLDQTTVQILHNLGSYLGLKEIERGIKDIAMVHSLKAIGLYSIEQGFKDPAQWSSYVLGILGIELVKHTDNKDSSQIPYNFYGQNFNGYKSDDMLVMVTISLMELGIRAIREIEQNVEFLNVIFQTILAIKGIGIRAIESGLEDIAVKTIQSITNICIESNKFSLGDEAIKMVQSLTDIGTDSIREGRENTTIILADCVTKIGINAIEEAQNIENIPTELLESIASNIGMLGIQAVEQRQVNVGINILRYLEALQIKAMDAGLNRLALKCKKYNNNLNEKVVLYSTRVYKGS
ncbi:DUF2254 domain-containing protein [Methanotrichaceae archaeon Mx]|uniref:DUF2254 domain-containing protein n=2 Tax=Candidatus Methanocrinis natronophilus TaxID=3033396 RepID=A0ABT5XAP3_9EURY|nr:DUF2254 domain-containing protein [Candidatus Methanocrinis natronophilus]